MYELIAKLLPLDVALLFASPMLFALALLFLGDPVRPKLRTVALFLGMLSVGVAVTIGGFVVGQATVSDAGPTLISAIIDLALGVLFIIFAIKAIAGKEERAKKDQSKTQHIVLRSFFLGFIINVLNLDALIFMFTGAKETSAAHLGGWATWLLLIIGLLFFTAPVTFPLVLTLLFPKTITPLLSRMNQFMVKYSKYILFIVFLGFGIWLVYTGAKVIW